MLESLSRSDTPRGLTFSLGYRVEPGSCLVFIGSSSARAIGVTRGGYYDQLCDSLNFINAAALRVADSAKIVKVRRYLTTVRDERAPGGRRFRNQRARGAWEEIVGPSSPASTSLQVPGSALMGSLVDLEAWAVAPPDSLSSEVVRVRGDGLVPTAIAVRGDQRLCVATAKAEPAESVELELLTCLTRIRERFAEHGAGLGDVLKLTVYYRDPRSWPAIEAMVVGVFGDHCPVTNGVVVANLETPDGNVEVTGWARCRAKVMGEPSSDCGTVNLGDRLLATTGSGALPIFTGGEASEMYSRNPPPTIEEQAHLGMANQKAILEAAGASFADVFRSNWYLTDFRDWEAIEPIVRSYFPGDLPVPTVVEVSRLTAKQGVRFEPDLWASLPA